MIPNYHKELLLDLITEWNDKQLTKYIEEQERRAEDIYALIKELKKLQRRRSKKNKLTPENGARDGR